MINQCNSNTTFLDLDVVIDNGRFVSKLYDKWHYFGFKVIAFPNLCSNIPDKTFIGELYRICKSSSKYKDFVDDVKLLIKKLISQKFEKKYLCPIL